VISPVALLGRFQFADSLLDLVGKLMIALGAQLGDGGTESGDEMRQVHAADHIDSMACRGEAQPYANPRMIAMNHMPTG